MTASDSTVINFSTSTSSSDINLISIELDGDYHITLYGENKSEFAKTELVYLKVFPTYSESPYDILTSKGTCIKFSQNEEETIIENIAFENVKSVELSDDPIGAVTTSWVAGTGASVLVNGKTITTPLNVIGILKCEYKRKFDRLQLTVPQSMTDESVIVMVGSDEDYVSETIEYTGEGTTFRDITLVIKDIVSDSEIAGATVVVEYNSIQIFSGAANSQGRVTLQDLTIGASYDIKITATNYLDSDSDYLNNDSFTVPVI